MENQKFDPRRATIGVHNRVGFEPGHKPANKGHQKVAVEPEFIASGNLGVGTMGDSDFESGRAAAMRVGRRVDFMDTYESMDFDDDLEKEAEDTSFGEYTPEDVEWPQFPDVGAKNIDQANRRGPVNVDLEVHGSHEHPKPDPKQLIKERLLNMRRQMVHDAKKEIQEEKEQAESKYEQYQSYPVDLEIDRRKIDIDRSGTITKGASSILSVLEEKDANPIKIMLVMDQQWPDEWREWEPETIVQTLEHEGVSIARLNLDKLMAVKVLMNTTEFWNSPRVFEKVCLAFAGRMVDWGHIQEPRVHEIAACVSLVERYIAEHEFSDDVAAYVAGSAVRDGFVLLPPVLSFAQWPFSNELAFSMGDDVLEVQHQLMKALEEEADIPQDHGVQYMRLLRCQYHIQDMIDQAKS